jgi:hypothetical protein
MARPKKAPKIPTTSVKLTELELSKVTGDLLNARNASRSGTERALIDGIVMKMDKAKKKFGEPLKK